jgi:hypothetical protein
MAPVAPELRIEPSQADYAPGSTVILVLRNIGETDLYYSTCGSLLQRLSSDGWSAVDADDVVCTRSAILIHPGQSIESRAGILPTDLTAGIFRYVIPSFGTDAEPTRSVEARSSAPFRVVISPP